MDEELIEKVARANIPRGVMLSAFAMASTLG